MSSDPEVVVIGGGPGGTAAATTLARRGRRVLLLERDRFPRFHIGESLLPYNRRLFDALGLLPRLEQAGFLIKHGAQFHSANGRHALQLIFRRGKFTRERTAFQVERAVFDHLLLHHARDCGVDCREGWTVKSVTADTRGATVAALDPDGRVQDFPAAWVIDASGRANLTGNQDGLREFHPRHKKLAIYSHFAGVRLDPGERGTDSIIVRLAHQWFWIIPLALDKVSVGCVLDQADFARQNLSAEQVFQNLVDASPALRDRLGQARSLIPFEVTTDFSYLNRRLVGPRLLRVGDAAGFIDPIFSSGVFLAMYTGHRAALVAARALETGTDAAAQLAGYERCVRAAFRRYWRFVEAFYTQPFTELLFSPSERFRLASAVNAVLAGEVDGGWRLGWRLALFFLMVRIQARFPVAPRITFQ